LVNPFPRFAEVGNALFLSLKEPDPLCAVVFALKALPSKMLNGLPLVVVRMVHLHLHLPLEGVAHRLKQE